MKRILIATLVGVMAFSVVTLGGWKFGADQIVDIGGANYPFTAYVGYDFFAPYVDMGPLSIGGDMVISRDYNWASSILSGLLSIDGELTFSYLASADVVLSMGVDVDYAPLPAGIDLVGWDGGLEVIGYVNDALTLNAGANFVYGDIDPSWVVDLGFNTTFFFGFDAEW